MAIDVSQLLDLSVRLNKAAVNAAPRVMRELERIGIYLVGYIKTNKLSGNPIHRRSGNLSRHIDYEVQPSGDGGRLRVGVVRGAQDVPYAPYLETGTRPHVIVPIRKKVLANVKAGQVFGKVVHHPGTPAYHFMRDTLRENKEMITDRLRKAAAEGVKNA